MNGFGPAPSQEGPARQSQRVVGSNSDRMVKVFKIFDSVYLICKLEISW